MLHAGTIFFPHENAHAISVPILVEHIYSQAVHSLFAVFAADLHISKQINFECFAHPLEKFKKIYRRRACYMCRFRHTKKGRLKRYSMAS